MEAKVNRLAALIEAKVAKHVPARKPDLRIVEPDENASLESSAMRAWNAFEGAAEQLCAPALDTSHRAVKTREILRIAQTYGWQSAIAHFLDTRGAGYISDLTDPQLDDLHDRMLGYLDAAMSGCSSPDELPAS